MHPVIEIRITPTKKLFLDEESSFGIYSAEVHEEDFAKNRDAIKLNAYLNISIKGRMPTLSVGEEYVATLTEEIGSKIPGTYLVENIRQERPTTPSEQRKFFEMVLTPLQVANIFKVYEGQDVIELIQNDTFDYQKVTGVGAHTYEKMKEKVLTNLELSELLVFLGKHGITYKTIQKLVKKYQSALLVKQKIEENPYVLTEVKGIGFKTADDIAKKMGYDLTSPHRIDSALAYVVEEEQNEGHSWIGRKQLLNRSITLLSLSKKTIEERLNGEAQGFLKIDDDRFTTEAVYEAERYVAQRITEFQSNVTPLFAREEIDAFLTDYCERNSVQLEENQYRFFHDWNENAVLMLIGSGGMGKTWIQRILIELIETKKPGFRVSLLSPTGKASKVLSENTGREAMTIHRKVGVHNDEGGGKKDIWEDALIVDEASMCDIAILSKLMKSIKNTRIRLLFVGDDFQLPSVGVGNFLYDCIHSGLVHISRLKKVFRQEEGGILDIATKIRDGQSFLNSSATGRHLFGKDCVFWLCDSVYMVDGVLKNYRNALKRYEQEDIAILTPTNKGRLGTIELNKQIQAIINPPAPHKKQTPVGRKDSPTIYRVGDRVMNTVNNYDMPMVGGGVADVFNGDTGRITEIHLNEKLLVIDFEGVVVEMPFGNIMASLIHAWVMTIHKSQGSQYKVIIALFDKSAKYQLNANLMYTGESRAKEYSLTLGQADAINHGIKKFINMERRSFLQELLQEMHGGSLPHPADDPPTSPPPMADKEEAVPLEWDGYL